MHLSITQRRSSSRICRVSRKPALIAYFTPNSMECLEILAKDVLPHIANR